MKRQWIVSAVLLVASSGDLSAGEWVVDDFADRDLEARPGLSWIVIADDVLGGGSRAGLSLVSEGQGHALRLEGSTGQPPDGLPVSFVGVWTAVGVDGRSHDLSAFDGIRLRARSDRAFSVGVRGATTQMNYMASVSAAPGWTEVDIPFSELRPLAAAAAAGSDWITEVGWIGLSVSAPAGAPVRLTVDRIALYGGPQSSGPPASSDRATGSSVAKTRLIEAGSLRRLAWKALAEDAAGDGLRAGLPDAIGLSWAEDQDQRVWFRVQLAEAPPERWFGINVALETSGDGQDGMTWWGTNSTFRFDQLVTAYLSRGDDYWQGLTGVASHADVQRGEMDTLTSDVVASVDREQPALLVGVPRSHLPAKGSFGLIATVGSSMSNNDDLPNTGSVELTLPEIASR